MTQAIEALKVYQWLPNWDKSDFGKIHRRKPPEFFYLFSLDARTLHKLSDIQRRTPVGARREDTRVQRRLIPEKAKEIKQFVNYGFPVSENPSLCKELDERMLDCSLDLEPEFSDQQTMIMPGWLPTAIIANIKSIDEMKTFKSESNAIILEDKQLILPDIENSEFDGMEKPLRIIDGQHRLLALSEIDDVDFQLPVVAFYDLDVAWEAYLFYTINIKPKRINRSLSYDLYPLLRTQDWLEAEPSKGSIYRDARAQEIVEALWSYEKSTWKNRINMLGDPNCGTITQASFVRSIASSFLRSRTHSVYGKGLFASNLGPEDLPLSWTRAQQAAYIIVFWQKLENIINESSYKWTEKLRSVEKNSKVIKDPTRDNAIVSKDSLLATDQGVRALMLIFNKMSINYYEKCEQEDDNPFKNWVMDAWSSEEGINDEQLNDAIENMPEEILAWVEKQALSLSSFDWQNSSAPGLSDEEKLKKSAYRGSTGYTWLFKHVEEHVSNAIDGQG